MKSTLIGEKNGKNVYVLNPIPENIKIGAIFLTKTPIDFYQDSFPADTLVTYVGKATTENAVSYDNYYLAYSLFDFGDGKKRILEWDDLEPFCL